MALNSIEMYALAQSANFRKKIEMLSLIVAGEVSSEDISLLTGGIEEHNHRFDLAQLSLSPTDELATKATKGISANLRDALTMPVKESENETMESRAERLAESIDDNTILSAIRANWTFASGFNINAYVFNNP